MFLALKGKESTALFGAHKEIEDINQKHGTNLRVISHDLADCALDGTLIERVANVTVRWIWESFLPAGLFPVDAAIGYEQWGVPFGDQIVYHAQDGSRVILPTGKYRGETDIGLVAVGLRSTDFKQDGKTTILDISDDRLVVTTGIPDRSFWNIISIPTVKPEEVGTPMYSSTKWVWRNDDAPYVGLIARHAGIDNEHRLQGVFANSLPSTRVGVVAEVPNADFRKLQALLRE
jgi:hypothetical protein